MPDTLVAWVEQPNFQVSCVDEDDFPEGQFSLILGSNPLYARQYLNFTYSWSAGLVRPTPPPTDDPAPNVDYIVAYNISVDDWNWNTPDAVGHASY